MLKPEIEQNLNERTARQRGIEEGKGARSNAPTSQTEAYACIAPFGTGGQGTVALSRALIA